MRYARNKNLTVCCLVSITNPKISPFKIIKRNMWHVGKSWLKKISEKHSTTYTHMYTPQCRNFATVNWNYKVRIEPPLKKNEEKPNVIVTHKHTGFKVMHPKDASGKNHILMVEQTFVSDVFYLVYGAFTSSSKIIEGITPEFVSEYQFNLKKKAQYFLRYPEPKLIEKDKVKQAKLDIFSTLGQMSNKLPAPLSPEQQLAKDTLDKDLQRLCNSITPVPQDLY